jgi:hypothetical protein
LALDASVGRPTRAWCLAGLAQVSTPLPIFFVFLFLLFSFLFKKWFRFFRTNSKYEQIKQNKIEI